MQKGLGPRRHRPTLGEPPNKVPSGRQGRDEAWTIRDAFAQQYEDHVARMRRRNREGQLWWANNLLNTNEIAASRHLSNTTHRIHLPLITPQPTASPTQINHRISRYRNPNLTKLLYVKFTNVRPLADIPTHSLRPKSLFGPTKAWFKSVSRPVQVCE